MKQISFGRSTISPQGPCYVIAEIGNNHQGDLQTALKMIRVAAGMGADAVKFQKRDNATLYTRAMYRRSYDNANSYGATYGEHREFLEFDHAEYLALMQCAADNDVEFLATAFDVPSADFLESLGVTAYKVASCDITNTPLLAHIAKYGKPMFVSTGAATMEEVHLAYDVIRRHNDQLCLLHCTAGYPTEYENLNLDTISTLREEFPAVAIGYSGHDNGILAPALAYTMGAVVVEKHFTLNRAWKGTDHAFSLEPTGLYKMVRDLRRIDVARGVGEKKVHGFEREAREKMGKSLYAARTLRAGTVVEAADIAVKSPGGGLPPYRLAELVGQRLLVDVPEETPFAMAQIHGVGLTSQAA